MKANDIAARREQVSGLILQHKSVREMAAELDIPASTVFRDLKSIRLEWQEHRLEASEHAAAEDILRLEAAERAIWPKVEAGDLMAIATLLRIMERRARLLGLDAPTKIDITERIRRLAEDEGLDPAEAIREAERMMRAF